MIRLKQSLNESHQAVIKIDLDSFHFLILLLYPLVKDISNFNIQFIFFPHQ